jgi:hypothetical protein
MKKQISALFIACACASGTSVAIADTLAAGGAPTVQLAARKPVTPVMSHEVATLIQITLQAEAQYRRTGSPQDLARVNAMRIELAKRGYKPGTQTAPVVMASFNSSESDYTPNSVVVSSAQ